MRCGSRYALFEAPSSPLTGEVLTHKLTVPNYAVAGMIEDLKATSARSSAAGGAAVDHIDWAAVAAECVGGRSSSDPTKLAALIAQGEGISVVVPSIATLREYCGELPGMTDWLAGWLTVWLAGWLAG